MKMHFNKIIIYGIYQYINYLNYLLIFYNIFFTKINFSRLREKISKALLAR